MRQRPSTLILALLLSFSFACSTPSGSQQGTATEVTDGKPAPTTEYYVGNIDIRRGKQNIKTPTVMRLETRPGENRVAVDFHYRPNKRESAQNLKLELERIGNTEVFAVVNPDKALQGRVRFTNGEEWKWGAWAIGLTLPNGDALAGAMVRNEATADYQLRLEATGPKGQKIESGSGSLRFVTEGDYQSLMKSWNGK